MGEIGAAGDTQAAYDAYQNIGGYLSAYGFNVDFAPVEMCIRDRYFPYY